MNKSIVVEGKKLKVAILVADGFEETELIVCRDVLVRSDICVDMLRVVSESDRKLDADRLWATSALGLRLYCDQLFQFGHDWTRYQALIIPGGIKGVLNLSDNHDVLQVVRWFYQQQKFIGAICAGPLVLRAANIIEEQHLTSYPGIATKFKTNSNYHAQVGTVVDCDHRLITSQSLGTVFSFALTLIEQLLGISARKKAQPRLLIYDVDSVLSF